jgi:hypothetical protein
VWLLQLRVTDFHFCLIRQDVRELDLLGHPSTGSCEILRTCLFFYFMKVVSER